MKQIHAFGLRSVAALRTPCVAAAQTLSLWARKASAVEPSFLLR